MSTHSYEGTSDAFSTSTPVVDAEQGGVTDSAGPFHRVIQAHRIFTRRFDVSGVRRNSTVFVTLTEVSLSAGGALDVPFIGDATMKLYNVAPLDGGQVDVRGEIDWDSDLNIRVSFFVF